MQQRIEQDLSFLQAKGNNNGPFAFTVKTFCIHKVLVREQNGQDLAQGSCQASLCPHRLGLPLLCPASAACTQTRSPRPCRVRVSG